MFTSLFLELCSACDRDSERGEGVAFLKAMQSLYGLESICYLCLNLPKAREPGGFTHCLYSSSKIRQKTTRNAIATEKLNQIGLIQAALVNWREHERLAIELDLRCAAGGSAGAPHGGSLCLNSSFGEVALCGFAGSGDPAARAVKTLSLTHELRILAQYFHSHMLRLNGHDTAVEMLVSARELDCLTCTADGRTAAEASRILGISERTVRFHLNSARDKMNCANTTQAVAKAVSLNLIKVSGK